MFNIGNQIIIKPDNKEGFIYSIIDDNTYMVGIKESNTIQMQFLTKDNIELKPCEFGQDGSCDYTTPSSPEGQFACMYCELKRCENNL